MTPFPYHLEPRGSGKSNSVQVLISLVSILWVMGMILLIYNVAIYYPEGAMPARLQNFHTLFEPKMNFSLPRHTFRQVVMKEGESILHFVTRLYKYMLTATNQRICQVAFYFTRRMSYLSSKSKTYKTGVKPGNTRRQCKFMYIYDHW